MAHFAKLDDNNIVTNVIVVDNSILLDADNNENEQLGIDFCKTLFGQDTIWVQCSYNGNFRNGMAGIGYTYDTERDAFIMPKPYPSYVLNEETLLYEAPIAHPLNKIACEWDEENQEWINGFPLNGE